MASFETFIAHLVKDDSLYQTMFTELPELKHYLEVAYRSDGRDRWQTYSPLKRQISALVGWNGSCEPFRTMHHYKAMIDALHLALPVNEEETRRRAMDEEAV